MATNNLTPELDLMTRALFRSVQADASYLTESPAHRRQLLAILLEALSYMQLPNGNFVSKDTQVMIAFGSNDYSAYPCEWEADEEAAYEATNNQDTVETSAGSESSDTEVREAVLSEDV